MWAYNKGMDSVRRSACSDAFLPERAFGYRVSMLRHVWTRRADAALAPTGLTHMQFFLLRTIEHVVALGRVPSQTDLADYLHVDRMTVGNVVRTLEAKGILTRGVHPQDPRANSVQVTDLGARLRARATELVMSEQDRFFGRLGHDGKAQFGAMLDRLLAADGSRPDTLSELS